ncbi:Rieske (2Fe-2S) protein [Fischerella sp. JS2]|uniref:Rieske (2Fe-2S) protein n=1 Tax=Fischerella sp. JS2 TaxID=2597771 RepID=UPI0028EE94EA|nr:Rieske 2Fe-2S domain-containing protein [Fischerella sp. JS2]
MGYVTVARVEEIPPGHTQMVQVGSCLILLVNDQGEFYALQGLCGHQNLPLAGGKVWQGVLDCPWHHFQYDIRTGENLYPKRIYPLNALPKLREQISPLRTYPVQVVEEQVQVGVPQSCESSDCRF